jgi:hypothetical protein
MLRCRDCNSSLTKEEKECFTCGHPVEVDTRQSTFGRQFATVIKFVFLFSLAMVPLSLFMESLSFNKCLMTTLVLFFVRSSADQMLEKKKG